jgi:hypothetical protein
MNSDATHKLPGATDSVVELVIETRARSISFVSRP